MNHRMRKTIFTLALLSANIAVQAQLKLSLSDVMQLAERNNIAATGAERAVEQAKAQKREAMTGYFPSVSAIGGAFDLDKHLVDLNMSGMPVQLVKDGVIGSVQVSQPVFAGGRIVNGNRLAKVGLEVGRIQREQALNNVRTTSSQYYWQIVSLQEKLRTLDAVAAMMEKLETDVAVAVEAGVTMRNDLLQVQLRRNEIEAARIKAASGLDISRQMLAQYIGANSEGMEIESDMVIGEIPVFPASLRRNHEQALLNTAEYRLLEQNVKAKTLEKKIEIGENLPALGVGASIIANNIMDDWKNTKAIYATVSVPLSSWWGGSNAIKRKRLAQKQAEDERNNNSELLIIRMNKLWSDIEDAHKQLGIAKKSMEQSDENLRLNNEYYKAGTSQMSNLLDAQQQYQQTRDKFVDAYAEYQICLLNYKQAVGE